MILIDSHGYSSQAGTHVISLAVVMYVLICVVKMPVTQSHVLACQIYYKYIHIVIYMLGVHIRHIIVIGVYLHVRWTLKTYTHSSH